MPNEPLADAFVQISPDLENFRAELDAQLREAITGAGGKAQIGVGVDDAEAQAKMDALRAKIDELEAKRSDVIIGMDDGHIQEQLAVLRAELADLEHQRVNIPVDVDNAAANAKLLETKAAADSASGSAFGGTGAGGISGLWAAGLALGPALIPVAGAVTAGLGAMLVPLTAAGLGFGALGVFALPAIQEIGTNLKKTQPFLQAFEAAQPGPAQGLAWAGLQAQIAKLPPELRPVVQGIVDVKLQIHSLAQTAGVNQALYGSFTIFLDDIKKLLPQIAPIAREAALALGDLGVSVGKGLDSPAWHSFLDKIVPQIRPAIDAIGRSLGELIKGLGGVVQAFIPFAGSFESGMVRITTAFANWGQNLGSSQGFQTFMQWVRDNSKPVGDAIKSIADALVNIVKASAGLGGIEIRAIGEIAKALSAIAAIPGLGPIVIDTGLLALAIGKLVTAAKGLGIVQLALGGIGSAAEGAGIRGLGFSGAIGAISSSAIAAAAPLALLAAALLDTKSKQQDAEGAAHRWETRAQSNIGTYAGLSQEVQSATDVIDRNNTAWWDQGSVLTNWADKQKHTLDAMTPVQQELVNAKGHVDDLSRAWGVSGDVIARAAQQAGISIHDLGNKGHDAQIAVGVAMDGIEQAIGRLPAAVAADANQAMAGLTQALQRGQAPGAASQSEAAIEDAYKKLNVIPGMGQNVMNLLKTTVDSYGKQISDATHKNVDDLIGNYQRLPPPVQDAVRQAMEELNSGLASGNQDAINDAKAKLATLSGNYAAFATDAGVQGTKAGHDFTSNLIGQMQDGLGSLKDAMAAYDKALQDGLNPLLASIGAKTFGPGSQVPFFSAASGGRIGGGFTTNGPQVIVGEGNQKYPEYVIPTDPAHRGNAVSLLASLAQDLTGHGKAAGGCVGGCGGMAHGGILGLQDGGIVPALSGLLGSPDGGGTGGGSLNFPVPPGGFQSGSSVPPPPSAALLAHGSVPASFGSGTNQDALDLWTKVKAFADVQAAARAAAAAGAGIGGAGPAVTGACGDWVHQGNLLAGASSRMSDACLMARAMNESGCNPSIVNTTDSNAAAGTPSQGLMQFVPSTFAANSVAGCNDINNPICQVAASAHCSPGNCGHGGYGCASGGILGSKVGIFDNGGVLMPGMAGINMGSVPELVTPIPLGQGGAFGGDVHIGGTTVIVQSDVSDSTMAKLNAWADQRDRTHADLLRQQMQARGVIKG